MGDTAHYNDIINLPHYVSKSRPRMSNYQRAAQFSPFWALNGHEAMVRETERFVDDFTELAGDQMYLIDFTLREISENLNAMPAVWLTYFEPDKRKKGGRYIDITGQVSGIDQNRQEITLANGPTVSFEQIRAIHL